MRAVAVGIAPPPGTGVFVEAAITATVGVQVAVGSTAEGTAVNVGLRVAVSVGSAVAVVVPAGGVVEDWTTALVADTVGVIVDPGTGASVGVPVPTGL